MADSTTTTAASSPTSSHSQPLTKPAITDNTSSNFAFLVHSQQTLINGLPPNVDNKPFVRPRRRRTSPEDHAVLEAEYQRNPKPDKSERLSIVRRVALGEKEVQIWFQNRRQQTRRKTQPLLPHEVFSNLHASQDSTESASLPSSAVNISSQPKPFSSQTSIGGTLDIQSIEKVPDSKTPTPTTFKTLNEQTPTATALAFAKDVSKIESGVESSSSQGSAYPDLESNSSHSQDGPATSQVEPVDASACELTLDKPAQLTCVGPTNKEEPCTLSCPGTAPIEFLSSDPSLVRSSKRTSSSIRLSLSLDGEAKVVLESESSPSPPKLRQSISANKESRHEPLRRSRSEVGPASQPFQSHESEPLPMPRCMPTGRSRDARTWEFYCDSDARNALTIQAEEEQKGSAERAIGLIRSSNNRLFEQPVGSQNAKIMTGKDLIKRKKNSGQSTQKPKLARTASSFARLQTADHKKIDVSRPKVKAPKPNSELDIFCDPEGDSDKENWEPGTQRRNIDRPRTGGASARSQFGALGESDGNLRNPPSRKVTLSRPATPKRKSVDAGKCGKIEKTGAAAAGGENGTLMGESGEEDLDCVQNLLSLSQGAWR